MGIGKRLKAARMAAGISQKQLAKRAGVAQSTISDLEKEKNERSPTGRIVHTLEAALGVSLRAELDDVHPSLQRYLASPIGRTRRITGNERAMLNRAWFDPGEDPTIEEWDEYLMFRRRMRASRRPH